MTPANAPPPRSVLSLLKRYGIFPQKRLGQHFLIAAPTMEKIIAALDCAPDDVVIDIGSGFGVMAARLAARARRVIAIEKDRLLFEAARAEFGAKPNITWMQGDILELPFSEIVAELAPPAGRIKVVGNLPYNIASPILFLLLEHRELVSQAVLMVQREVADRIVARPGSRDYGILSVLLQAEAFCARLFAVSAKSFFPVPQVASAVVRIEMMSGKSPVADGPLFRTVVKGAFGKRRKTLRNALLGARDLRLTPAEFDGALRDLAIDGRRRAEELSVQEFLRLAKRLGQCLPPPAERT